MDLEGVVGLSLSFSMGVEEEALVAEVSGDLAADLQGAGDPLGVGSTLYGQCIYNVNTVEIREGSHSGLVRNVGNVVWEKSHQEFESLTLRQHELARVPRGSRVLEICEI